MDWNAWVESRLRIGAAVAIVIVTLWYVYDYRPRSASLDALARREASLTEERGRVLADIERTRSHEESALPARATAPRGPSMTPVERLNELLERITKPANALDLDYLTVTPLAPRFGKSFEELPFTISVAGPYVALADYLHQLEYGQSFVVRRLAITQHDPSIQAEFQLSALLLTDAGATLGSAAAKDPGRPTSVELARDPFVRPPARLARSSDGKNDALNVPLGLHLSGIMSAGSKGVAIINHEPYTVGASIENKTITRISDRGVELSDKVRSYFLEMERPRHSSGARAKQTVAR